jgi:hypothetical protein
VAVFNALIQQCLGRASMWSVVEVGILRMVLEFSF